MSIGVIVVAAGRGDRLGAAVPKQFLDLAGHTLLERSVAAFDDHPDVTALVVVVPDTYVELGRTLTGTTRRPCTVVAGGARRQDSVACGLAALAPDTNLVLVHDAARPFVTRAIIDRVIAAAAETGAAVPAVPARDTVKIVDRDSRLVTATPARDDVWLAQTPQGFRRDVLAEAVALGASGIEATDEAMLAERAGRPVRVVEGDPDNVKITTPADLAAARARLGGSGAVLPRVGSGYDLHRLAPGRPLVLAGVTMAGDRGPLGHSDGDVVSHALVDAILGAAGAGDIGRHFPDTDPAWKDAPGLDLLARAVAIVRGRGWTVINVDVTVVLERPKIAPHVAVIRARLAAVLGIAIEAVSVKGKTNEGVDAVGRGEAIAAHAVALLAAASEAAR